MDSIALIIPYFGKIPAFYKLWEITALANETIDFLIYTDSHDITAKKNIHVTHITFNEFKAILQKEFDFPIACSMSYKLCDYKPTYGQAFRKTLKNYDWWGYCDIDMLLGDLRAFFDENILKQYDRCGLLGHISIFRNCDRMNELYRFQEEAYPALNYDKVFKTEESMYFDEIRGMYTKSLLSGIRIFRDAKFRDPLKKESKFYHRTSSGNMQFVIMWRDGKCYSVDAKGQYTELAYAHFFRRKFNVQKSIPQCIESIVVAPGVAKFASEVVPEDFDLKEGKCYKSRFCINSIRNSVKRYGLFGTLRRQKWSKDHDRYVADLERRLGYKHF